MGKRGQRVFTDGDDEAALSRGVYEAYVENLRYSQVAPQDMFAEKNTGATSRRRSTSRREGDDTTSASWYDQGETTETKTSPQALRGRPKPPKPRASLFAGVRSPLSGC